MIAITLSWDLMKGKGLPMKYTEANGNYYIYCSSESASYTCVIPKGDSDSDDFEDNYKNSATSLV